VKNVWKKRACTEGVCFYFPLDSMQNSRLRITQYDCSQKFKENLKLYRMLLQEHRRIKNCVHESRL